MDEDTTNALEDTMRRYAVDEEDPEGTPPRGSRKRYHEESDTSESSFGSEETTSSSDDRSGDDYSDCAENPFASNARGDSESEDERRHKKRRKNKHERPAPKKTVPKPAAAPAADPASSSDDEDLRSDMASRTLPIESSVFSDVAQMVLPESRKNKITIKASSVIFTGTCRTAGSTKEIAAAVAAAVPKELAFILHENKYLHAIPIIDSGTNETTYRVLSFAEEMSVIKKGMMAIGVKKVDYKSLCAEQYKWDNKLDKADTTIASLPGRIGEVFSIHVVRETGRRRPFIVSTLFAAEREKKAERNRKKREELGTAPKKLSADVVDADDDLPPPGSMSTAADQTKKQNKKDVSRDAPAKSAAEVKRTKSVLASLSKKAAPTKGVAQRHDTPVAKQATTEAPDKSLKKKAALPDPADTFADAPQLKITNGRSVSVERAATSGLSKHGLSLMNKVRKRVGSMSSSVDTPAGAAASTPPPAPKRPGAVQRTINFDEPQSIPEESPAVSAKNDTDGFCIVVRGASAKKLEAILSLLAE